MDELIHHCIRELAFEGDLGCDTNRLQDFISEFYAHSGAQQTVDAAYYIFVWSLIVQHPEIRVGIAPDGAPEVYIAPQPSKGTPATKGKKKAAGNEDDHPDAVGRLEVIEDAAAKSLEDLKKQCGDKLRVAVDPERSLVAITGSHIKSSKLTPMVYTTLQLISRGREAGLSAVDLSKKTGYDAKTCHYLIDKLVELNLIEKRKKSGVGANFCIHKYFFERSEIWKGVLAEEGKLRQLMVKKEEEDDGDMDMDDMDDAASGPSSTIVQIQFDPIDSRHLSSLAIVKDRVEKLLRNSPHYMHSAQNLLPTIGFLNPVKTDRRFFQTRLRELIAQGFIDKVHVPKPDGRLVPCIRLLHPNEQPQAEQPPDAIEILDDDEALPPLKANVTFHKQLIDLIEQAGTEGTTLNELSQALCSFDRRTMDHQLNRLKETPLPPHLRDLGIVQLAETYGREHRYKYFTSYNYQKVIEREELEAPYPVGFFGDIGGFMVVEDDQFYENEEELEKFVDDYRVGGRVKAKGKKKQGKQAEKAVTTPKATARGKKRKRDEDETEVVGGSAESSPSMAPPPLKKKRGRPPKVRAPPPEAATPAVAEETVPTTPIRPEVAPNVDPPTTAKKRGRPRKSTVDDNPTPKKRGRPSKKKPADESATVPVQDNLEPQATSAAPDDPSIADLSSNAAQNEVQTHPVPAPNVVAPAVVEDTSEVASAPLPGLPIVTQPGSQESVSGDQPAKDDDSQVTHNAAAPSQVEPSDLGPHPSTAATTGVPPGQNKRPAPGTPPPQPSAKRIHTETPHTSYRGRTNLSYSRREKEILRLITELGGIANVSTKEFYEAHTALLERMSSAGEAVSDNRQGSRIDKKTMDAILKALQDQEKLRVITTSVHNRPIKVAYLTDISPELLTSFLGGLSHTVPFPFSQPANFKTLETSVEYGGSKSAKVVKPRASVMFADQATANGHQHLGELDGVDLALVRENLLADQQAIQQLYGFIPGKIARVKELHLHVMSVFDENTNEHIVSFDQRVLHLSYFYQDLPISTYCAIVSCQAPNDELKELLSTPEGRATPLSKVSIALADALELGKTRSRTRLLNSLVTLQDLHLITPLLPSDSERPWIRCAPNGDHPTAFAATVCDGTATLQSPQHWRFNTSVPIQLWEIDDTSPPFWKHASIQSQADAVVFWSDLQRACINATHAERLVEEMEKGALRPAAVPANIPIKLAKLLRRSRQWKASYVFSDRQIQVLKQFVDTRTGTTPLQDIDTSELRISRLAEAISAPRDDVIRFYEQERSRILHEIEKIRKKARAAEDSKRNTAKDRASIAQKAAEARAQRERDWDEMVARIHSTPLTAAVLTRLKTLRSRFLQGAGTTDLQKLEADIATAIEESKIPAKRANANRQPLLANFQPHPPAPPVVAGSANEKTVEELIALQGPAIAKKEALTKKKGKEKESNAGTSKVPRRRHRFTWNKDYEELAKDACAVIKARARDGKRIDWSGLEKVFPAVPRNSVRQRITQLREQPGAETYFKRLEDKWFDLWTKHQGTAALPDEDPTSVSNFDIIAHINFLRQHVDKNALRVGFLETQHQQPSVALPSTVSALLSAFEVVEKPVTTPTYDFMWNGAAEEGREKLFVQHAFVLPVSSTVTSTPIPPTWSYPSERAYVADAAVKMMLGTSNEDHNAARASDLLKSAGEEGVEMAVKEMLQHGVISKLVKDPKKRKPGRTLKISDGNQNAIGGPVAPELFQDASTFVDALASSQRDDPLMWREWPLLVTDGDAAALAELVSEGKLEIKIDTSGPQAVRAKIDWNSKKADDDDIETSIQLRSRLPAGSRSSGTTAPIDSAAIVDPDTAALPGSSHFPSHAVPDIADQPASLAPNQDFSGPESAVPISPSLSGHGQTLGEDRAVCRHALPDTVASEDTGMDVIVDCKTCLDVKTSKFAEHDQTLRTVWSRLFDAGKSGITKQALQNFETDVPSRLFLEKAVDSLVTSKLAFWTGYKEVVLVSAHFLSYWTVVIPPSHETALPASPTEASQSTVAPALVEPLVRVFPRRWLDVNGRILHEVWEAACRAVMGVVVFRPGISQAELRWRLRTVYDRAELHDVLRFLRDRQQLRVKRSGNRFVTGSPEDNLEEKAAFWFVGERRWFHM
ncbi:hypothetical protein BDW22DRAFT_1355246 [Trametopsis cervina]|nr:hypothetical protein BDW22DRAFT_1355246 [Trametopsis cervina]